MSKEHTPICKCGKKASYTYESLSKPKQVSLCERCNETRAENLIKGHNYALKMERTSEELLDHYCSYNGIQDENKDELLSIINAKVLEALESTSMKEAYNAGQKSMYCGCYDTKDCTSFEEWILNKQK